eukprot:4267154-Amphidinium_carterae.1
MDSCPGSAAGKRAHTSLQRLQAEEQKLISTPTKPSEQFEGQLEARQKAGSRRTNGPFIHEHPHH